MRSAHEDDHGPEGGGSSRPSDEAPDPVPGDGTAVASGESADAADWADETRGIRWLLVSGCGLGFVAWLSAGRLLPDVLPAGSIGPACVVAMAVIAVLRLRRVSAVANRRGDRAVKALLEAADGAIPSALPEGDPLVPMIAEATRRFERRLELRLAEGKAAGEARTRRDLLHLRAEFETLVEKHAKKSLAEKREAEARLAALATQREEERSRGEDERREGERRLGEAEAAAASLRERLFKLERTLAARGDENSRLADRAEALAREAETLRRQGVRFFDRLAAQLRGPLRIVESLAAEMADRAPEAGAAALEGSIGQIRMRVGQIQRLVDEIIELCKMEAAAVSLVYSELDAARLVRALVEEFEEPARAKGLRVSTRLARDLRGVRTDVRLGGKILRELISNAVRFTPRGGGIVVSAEIQEDLPAPDGLSAEGPSPEGRGGGVLCLSVSDTGPGISAEDQERIFRPFERGGEPRFTLADASAGLGLTLARGYARILGGDLTVESAVGRGSVFRLLLPAKAAVAALTAPSRTPEASPLGR